MGPTDIKVLEDYIAERKSEGHGGFGETALVMGTYPEMVRMDRCEVESGMSTHITDPLKKLGITWGRSWQADFPNSYAGDSPVGLNQRIADVAVEIAVERTVEVLKLLKNDDIMNPIIAAGYRK